MIPGEIVCADGEIDLNAGRETKVIKVIKVINQGDRPVQVGSHTHFFEVNRALEFPRETAYGFRLDIAAGTAVRFEPGEAREVALVALAGRRRVYGMNGLVNGELSEQEEALERAREQGFL